MMNTEQLNSYLEKRHENDKKEEEKKTETVETKVETEKKAEEPAKPEVETGEAKPAETEVQETKTTEVSEDKKEKVGSEEVKPKETETKPVEEAETKPTEDKKKDAGKKTYSRQEKIDYAFQKQKRKYEARIRELEEQLNEKKERPKFEENKEEYIRFEVDRLTKENEKKRLEEEYREARNQAAQEINDRRIESCFTDPAEQEKYRALVKSNGRDLVKILDREDPDGAIFGYLDDSELSPILTRILMTNREYRDEILSKSTAYGKLRAMEQLEAKVRWAQKQMENRQKKAEEVPQPAEQPKPAIPVVGTVTKSDSSAGKVVKDYNNVLHNLNQRKYHQ